MEFIGCPFRGGRVEINEAAKSYDDQHCVPCLHSDSCRKIWESEREVHDDIPEACMDEMKIKGEKNGKEN